MYFHKTIHILSIYTIFTLVRPTKMNFQFIPKFSKKRPKIFRARAPEQDRMEKTIDEF